MGMHKIAKMPSPEELKEEMPLSEEAKQIKAARDKEIRDVFTGKSDKFLVIIGLVLQIMKLLLWIILDVWQEFRKILLTSY